MKDKKMTQQITKLLSGVGGAVLGASLALALGISATAGNNTDLAREIKVDRTPPERDASHPMAGYANVVGEVSPSVVTVFSSRKAEAVQFQGGNPFGEDSPFRRFFDEEDLKRFFGDPRGQQQPQPRRSPMPQQRGQGSGVILTSDGYILTNNHVVAKADEIMIALEGRDEEYEAEVIGTDPQTDLAVVKIEAKDLPAATLGDSSQLRAGDVVLAIGNPFGLSQTVTSGIVSAVGRDNLNITGYENFIQTDASINPGNSGGALIDNRGRVVGINTAIFSRSGGNIGIGFAIPINMAVDIANELISDGVIERGYLGVMLGELTSDLAEALGLKDNEGVLINDVLEDTPAEKAGLEAGDVIVEFDGREVENMSKLRLWVGNTDPGDEVTFGIVRDGDRKDVTVKIGKLDADTVASLSGKDTEEKAEKSSLLEGVAVTELTDELREQRGLEEDVTGLLVMEVDPDSAAAEAGLRAGQVITEVAGQSVESVKDAMKAKAMVESGKLLLRVATNQGSRFLAVGLS